MSLSVEVRRFLPVARERVFEAWSDPVVLARWFVVEPEWTSKIRSDFRVGGSYRVDIYKTDGTVFVAHGTWLAIERPSRLQFTWRSQVPKVEDSTVTVDLLEARGGTEVVLRHDGLPEGEEGRMHEVGWKGILERLDEHVTLEDRGGKGDGT